MTSTPFGRLPLHCPRCGKVNDLHDSDTPGEQPHDGAIAICWTCKCVGIFVGTPPTSIRLPTPQEYDEIAADEGFCRAVGIVNLNPTINQAIDALRRKP